MLHLQGQSIDNASTILKGDQKQENRSAYPKTQNHDLPWGTWEKFIQDLQLILPILKKTLLLLTTKAMALTLHGGEMIMSTW